MSWWVTSAVERRKAEAMGDALRLGHAKITTWIPFPSSKNVERWMARCWTCGMEASVYADARVTGPAVVLRCEVAARAAPAAGKRR